MWGRNKLDETFQSRFQNSAASILGSFLHSLAPSDPPCQSEPCPQATLYKYSGPTGPAFKASGSSSRAPVGRFRGSKRDHGGPPEGSPTGARSKTKRGHHTPLLHRGWPLLKLLGAYPDPRVSKRRPWGATRAQQWAPEGPKRKWYSVPFC